jgi:hypothetical protein
MEKVLKCTFKSDGVRKDGSPYKLYEIETESGKKGSAFDEMPAGTEVEAKESEYNGKKQYQFFKPKSTKGFPAKDWGTPKRICALESALKYTDLMTDKSKMTAENVILLADKFLSFLNK